jgi:hypothetical protein
MHNYARTFLRNSIRGLKMYDYDIGLGYADPVRYICKKSVEPRCDQLSEIE